ncbi:MAG: hypothetical protein LUG45_05300 [Clostridiales bacterium]|nr:hypothetical protein [Clostridiales bacterium]
MKELQEWEEILNRYKIPYTKDEHSGTWSEFMENKEHITLHIEVTYEDDSVVGYSGFHCEILFDENGRFAAIAIGE